MSIDRAEIVSEGIRVEGAVYVTVLYLAANDERPMQAAAGVIPLSHVIEAGGITPGSCFTISPMLEQITTMIAPGGQEKYVQSLALIHLCSQSMRFQCSIR